MNEKRNLNSQWYYKHQDTIVGPLSKEELLEKIHNGIVNSDTLIRSDTNNNWIKAKSANDFLGDSNAASKSGAESASKAAEDILTGRRTRGFRRSSDEEDDESESFISRFSGFFSRLNFSWMSDLFDFLADKLEFLKYCFRAWVLIPLLLLIIVGLCINYFAMDWYRRSIAYDTYSNIWAELRQHREMEIDEHQWDEFKADVYGEIKKINSSIEKVATANDPYTMELLRAGRDCLPQMLDDARKAPSPSENKFAIHMNKAERFANTNYHTSISKKMTNIVGILFVVFDVLLLGWGALFVLQKIRS